MKVLCIVILSLSLISCKKQQMNKEELLVYIYDSENGISILDSKAGIESVSTFKPSELIVYNELIRRPDYSRDSLTKVYNSSLFFEITLSGQIPPSIHSQISKYVFNLSDYIQLVGGSGSIIELKDVQFPRLYGISGELMFLVAFDAEKVKNEETITLQINDFGLGVGQFFHSYKLKDLTDLPKLDFSTIISV